MKIIDSVKPVKAKSGLVFICVWAERYRRKDGSLTTLKVWRSHCRACGEPFTVKTPMNYRNSRSFDLVHCKKHRLC